jgi:hypothetical protein
MILKDGSTSTSAGTLTLLCAARPPKSNLLLLVPPRLIL